MKIGAHVSIAGGVFNAPLNAQAIGADTFQMFSRSPRGGKAPELTLEVVNQFKANLRQSGIENFYIHAPYFINLASKEKRIQHGSIQILREELERGSKLGAAGMMFHMGSAKDFGPEVSFAMVEDGLREILKGYTGKTKLLIENSAGAGEIIGADFETIGKLIKKIKNSRLGVCLDTCHMFASGYDFKTATALTKTLDVFDKKIGLKKLGCLHLNDSLTILNSHRDRHADIGFGEIGISAFKLLVKHPKLKHLDALLETPTINEDYNKQITKLKKLQK